MVAEKYCGKCSAFHPITDFVKHKECPDGYANYCKKSRNDRTKIYYMNNPEAYAKIEQNLKRYQARIKKETQPVRNRVIANRRRERVRLMNLALAFLFENGFTARTIAENIGIGSRAVREWRKGSRVPTTAHYDRLLSFWGSQLPDPSLWTPEERLERGLKPRFPKADLARARALAADRLLDTDAPAEDEPQSWKWMESLAGPPEEKDQVAA